MTDKKQIIIDTNEYFLEIIDDGGGTIGYTVVHPERLLRDIMKQNKKLARKTQECEELKAEKEELNNRMAEVTYRATGGRLSYSNYTLDAIEQAFNDQLEILSDQKVKEETKDLNQKLYSAQNKVRSKTEYIQEQRDIIKKLEQECEELKERLVRTEEDLKYQCVDCMNVKSDRYRKALEEIGKIVKINCEEICGRKFEDCNDFLCSSKNILDIINKAKGK